jgi:arylsulfatase A-like enzyme
VRVLVVNIPGLNLRYVGCYGNDWVDTPTLDSLAADGIVFDQHLADCLGDWPSLWTGSYYFPWLLAGSAPDRPGLEQAAQSHGLILRHVTPETPRSTSDVPYAACLDAIRRVFRERAKHLAATADALLWVDLPSLTPPWSVPDEHLARYFLPVAHEARTDDETDDELDDDQSAAVPTDWDHSNLEVEDEVRSEESSETAEEAEELLPLLCPPQRINPSDDALRERLQLTYAALVSTVDEFLGKLLDDLDRRGGPSDWVVLVTSERGLALGEHGIVGDVQPWLHEEALHVPLLLRLPGAAHACRRIAALTQPVDVWPTVLELIGREGKASHGRSLMALVKGQTEQHRDYACAGWRLAGIEEYALRTPQWGLLHPGDCAARPPQLYAKPDDRWEVNDLYLRQQELAEPLEHVLRAFLHTVSSPGAGPLPAPPASKE